MGNLNTKQFSNLPKIPYLINNEYESKLSDYIAHNQNNFHYIHGTTNKVQCVVDKDFHLALNSIYLWNKRLIGKEPRIENIMTIVKSVGKNEILEDMTIF